MTKWALLPMIQLLTLLKKLINKQKTMEKITIIRTCRDQGTKEEVSLEYAVQKLQGYWEKNYIKTLLLKGQMLWSPYANYQLKNLNN